VAAVFEKEIRYLLRSGPMLLTLIMPIFVLVIFRLGPIGSKAGRAGGLFARTPDTAFPAAAAYTLLLLTNLAYNNFGGDAGGIQFFYASPVRFRDIVLAKNLTHAGILAIETVVAWIGVSVLYGPPALDVTVASLAGLLFAAPINFSAGNLLSIYSPKKVDYSSFGRQRASQATVLISLGVQLFVIGVGVAAFWIARFYGNLWIATLILLLLAGISISAYVVILSRMDSLALQRRETLVAELCRA
jgi:ABC-2 type transport system permease protein